MYQTIKKVNPLANTVTLSCGHMLKYNVTTLDPTMGRPQWCDICQKQNQNRASDILSPDGGQKFQPNIRPSEPCITFKQIVQRMIVVHESKNQDYSVFNDKFSNFKQAAILSSWFTNPVDRVFATLIGIKLSRLAVLKNSQKTPNNESIADSHLDLDNYAVLWHEYTETIKLQEKTQINGPVPSPIPAGSDMSGVSEQTEGNSEAISREAQGPTKNREDMWKTSKN